MLQKIEFHKIRGIADVINASLQFSKENFKDLGKAILFISGPFILAATLIYSHFLYVIWNRIPGFQLGTTGFKLEITLIISLIVIASLVFYLVVYEYINIYIHQNLETIQISDVWKAMKKDLWFMIQTGFGLLIMLIVVVILFAIAVGLMTAIGSAISAITSPVAMFFFILPVNVLFFYLILPYSLIVSIRINERKNFLDSVSQCHKLISGHRLRTFGIIFLSIALQFMLSSLVNIPNYLMQYFNVVTFSNLDYLWVRILFAGLVIILGFFIGAISIVSINFQYFNLLERTESPFLLNKINSIGNAADTTITTHEETY